MFSQVAGRGETEEHTNAQTHKHKSWDEKV